MSDLLAIGLVVIFLPAALAAFVWGIDALIVQIENIKWRLRR